MAQIREKIRWYHKINRKEEGWFIMTDPVGKVMSKQEFMDKFIKDRKEKQRKAKFEYYEYKESVVKKSCRRRSKW